MIGRLGLTNTHPGMPIAPSALALELRSVLVPASRDACVAPNDICKNVLAVIEETDGGVGVGGGTGAAQREFGAAIQVVLQAATSLTEQVLDAQAHLWQT